MTGIFAWFAIFHSIADGIRVGGVDQQQLSRRTVKS